MMLPSVIYPQSWNYEKGGNPFDGKYKTASIIGIGSEFPYQRPMFVVNVFEGKTGEPNLYLAKVPCACCDNSEVKVKFDDVENIYTLHTHTNENKDVWFLNFESGAIGTKNVQYDTQKQKWVIWSQKYDRWIEYDKSKEVPEISPLEGFIKDMKSHSKMYVRLTNECLKYDCEFSLSGSTAAINFVLTK